jgi:hypothetical protein
MVMNEKAKDDEPISEEKLRIQSTMRKIMQYNRSLIEVYDDIYDIDFFSDTSSQIKNMLISDVGVDSMQLKASLDGLDRFLENVVDQKIAFLNREIHEQRQFVETRVERRSLIIKNRLDSVVDRTNHSAQVRNHFRMCLSILVSNMKLLTLLAHVYGDYMYMYVYWERILLKLIGGMDEASSHDAHNAKKNIIDVVTKHFDQINAAFMNVQLQKLIRNIRLHVRNIDSCQRLLSRLPNDINVTNITKSIVLNVQKVSDEYYNYIIKERIHTVQSMSDITERTDELQRIINEQLQRTRRG